MNRTQGAAGRVPASAKPRWLFVVFMLVALVLPGCGAGTAGPTTAPAPTQEVFPTPGALTYWPTTEWKTSTPEEQGVDSAQLLKTLRHVHDAGINTRSMTVIRNGYIVMEAYNQPWTADFRVPVHSVTKSVIGTLTGIAIKEGYIKDVKQKVLGYFPEKTIANRDANKEAITIEDLLTMRPGLDCADEKLGSQVEQSPDWVQYTLDLPMASAPGKNLIYCTAGVHLLSAILSKATGMPAAAYAETRLFAPLGIYPSDYTWGSDPQGVTTGGYGIAMQPRDMGKFGLLYLPGGKWEDKQVVPADWVAESSKVHSIGSDGKNYGYLFWVYPTHYAAEGYGEQVIQVMKTQNMVVVQTSAIDFHKGPIVWNLTKDYVIPAAKPQVPLPANPSAQSALRAKVEYMANPGEPVQPLPEIAKRISGKTFVMEDNPGGWKELTLLFMDKSPEAQAIVRATAGTEIMTDTVRLGMDNVYRVDKSPGGVGIRAFRARWADDHTLVVRQLQSNPDVQETEMRVEFAGNTATMHVEEVIFETMKFDAKGTTK